MAGLLDDWSTPTIREFALICVDPCPTVVQVLGRPTIARGEAQFFQNPGLPIAAQVISSTLF
jgi:hypothetical protein